MFMWLFGAIGGNGFGFGGNRGGGEIAATDFAALASQLNNTSNTDLLMNAIQGNGNAIATLATNLNCDVNRITDGICAIRSSVDQVAGQVGFSAERVINAANMGDCRIIEALNACCCSTQKEIIKMSYENQLANCQQTNQLSNILNQGFSGVNYALSNGFSTLGYENQAQTCQIVTNSNLNTQRIIDTLNSHWQSDLQLRYNDARLELSQKSQNEYLISQLSKSSSSR